MSLNPAKLDAALADPAIAALSDADAATLLSSPILTPRPDRITYTTLGAVWGPAAAATFVAGMEAAIAAGNPLAIYVDKLLGGPGFDATDPGTAPSAAQLVSAGLCTGVQVTAVLNTISYRCGDVVAAADVAASRSRVSGYAAMEQIVVNQYNAAIAWLASGQAAGTASPNTAAVLAKLGTAQ
jgi:hypothetical protein